MGGAGASNASASLIVCQVASCHGVYCVISDTDSSAWFRNCYNKRKQTNEAGVCSSARTCRLVMGGSAHSDSA